MAAIPCPDFITDPPPPFPKRVICTTRTCIENRFAQFIFSMDLSPEQRGEVAQDIGAWSLWDIPTSHVCQIDDDVGQDIICVSIMDKVYWLDWNRYVDELDWNAFAPIYQRLKIGPFPSNESVTQKGAYDQAILKRLREFIFTLRDGNTGAPGATWFVTAAAWTNEDDTARTGKRRTTARMRTRISTKGHSGFVITLEHKGNEPTQIESWNAAWDLIGHRIREALVDYNP